MSISNRQLRRIKRHSAKRIKKQMRTDLFYLIKPKPKFLPRFLWIKILKKFLDLDFDNF